MIFARGHALGLCKAPRDNLHCNRCYTNKIELNCPFPDLEGTPNHNIFNIILQNYFNGLWTNCLLVYIKHVY